MQRIYLNDNWYFARNYTEDLLNPEADLSELRKVRIPHSVCELSYSNLMKCLCSSFADTDAV